jgi:hypothetical protein
MNKKFEVDQSLPYFDRLSLLYLRFRFIVLFIADNRPVTMQSLAPALRSGRVVVALPIRRFPGPVSQSPSGF